MSRLELNGRKVEFHPGETLLQLASRHGYAIPTICYHEATGTRGLCRVCAVEVAGQARPVPACATLAQEGMEVRTESDELHTLRRTIYEWTMLATDTSEAPEIEREAALLSTGSFSSRLCHTHHLLSRSYRYSRALPGLRGGGCRPGPSGACLRHAGSGGYGGTH